MSYSEAERQAANVVPPRRGAVVVVGTDATARPYDITGLAFAGNYNPSAAQHVFLTLRAVTTDCWYHFSDATHNDLDDTAKITAGSALAFTVTHGSVLPAGQSVQVRIHRNVDKWLIVKTAASTGLLIIHASSEGSPQDF